MDGKDRSVRIKTEILDKLDELKHINRKASYSTRIKTLIDFCSKNKKEFESWLEEETKK